ncbi:MAG: hypothetical protein V7K40_10335 [Nostoc sp.]|uniref:hypothetical protein n=1 Tax=Nostoc sp. TaxID=1180 RepID=UPI002FF64A43
MEISQARLYPFFPEGDHKGTRSLKNAGFAAYITFKYSLSRSQTFENERKNKDFSPYQQGANSICLIAITSEQLKPLAKMVIKTCFFDIRVFCWNDHLARLLKTFVIY